MCLVKEFVCDLIVPHWKKFFVIIFATIAHNFFIFLIILCRYDLFTVFS